jgi:hypothetical protein
MESSPLAGIPHGSVVPSNRTQAAHPVVRVSERERRRGERAFEEQLAHEHPHGHDAGADGERDTEKTDDAESPITRRLQALGLDARKDPQSDADPDGGHDGGIDILA